MRDSIATEHSELRLLKRTGDIDITMTELWEQSIPCEIKGHGYQEARVSPEYDVVLLMEGGRVVTVLGRTDDITIDYADMQRYLDRVVR